MISKYSFTCPQCHKYFEIKCHWYNQMLIEWLGDFKWICHCIAHHRNRLNRNGKVFILKTIASFPPILLLQILAIIVAPLRDL